MLSENKIGHRQILFSESKRLFPVAIEREERVWPVTSGWDGSAGGGFTTRVLMMIQVARYLENHERERRVDDKSFETGYGSASQLEAGPALLRRTRLSPARRNQNSLRRAPPSGLTPVRVTTSCRLSGKTKTKNATRFCFSFSDSRACPSRRPVFAKGKPPVAAFLCQKHGAARGIHNRRD